MKRTKPIRKRLKQFRLKKKKIMSKAAYKLFEKMAKMITKEIRKARQEFYKKLWYGDH